MPKGHKCIKYVTLKRGEGHEPIQFRRIAALMTERGHKMNHATARAILHGALRTIARAIVNDDITAERLLHDASFQCFVGDMLLAKYMQCNT